MRNEFPSFCIGVKYCGNCNERYSKKAAYKWIVDHSPKHFVFEAAVLQIEKTFDYILVFNGCQAQCADIRKLKYTYGLYSIYQDTDWQDVLNRLLEADRRAEKENLRVG